MKKTFGTNFPFLTNLLKLIVFIKDCTSLGSVGVRKNVFSRGLSRKSEYFLSVCTILLSIF